MTHKKKLIEVALPLDAINKAAAREKSIRHGHPSTLHLWWARRPLAAARAVLWASLVDDPSAHPDRFPTEEDQEVERQRLFRILEDLVLWENSNNERVLEAARTEIEASCDGELPNVLDPFCGGGTIPLEAQRLGLPAYGGDLNPVAVLISKAMVEIPSRFADLPPVNPDARAESGLKTWDRAQGLAEDVRWYGQWMRDRAFERIGHLYPKVKLPPEQGGGEATVIAWIWARTVESPDPSWNGHVPLVRSWVLRKKKGKPVVWVEPVVDRDTQTITYRIREGGTPVEGTIKRGKGRCIATGSVIDADYIKSEAVAGRLHESVIAIVAEGQRRRVYLSPDSDAAPIADLTAPELGLRGPVPTHSQYMGMPRYGLDTWEKLFLPRQAHTLATFYELLAEVHEEVAKAAARAGLPTDNSRLRDGGAGPVAYADALTTYLAFAVDRSLARWTSLAIWNSVGEKTEHVFRLQAYQMSWEFAEANPFSSSTGNWAGQAEWVAKALEELPARTPAVVVQRDAEALINSAPTSVFATDPPYYDNVPYSDLSDFYYVWLRRYLNEVWPDELSTIVTPKAEELVADVERLGGRTEANRFFEEGMRRVLSAAVQRHDDRFPMSIFYAFQQSETVSEGTVSTGWESFLEALLGTGLTVVSTWPVRTEMPGGVRNFGRNSLASSIVLICRARKVDAALATRSEFLAALRAELPGAIRLLQKESIAPVDMAQSAIGPGMAVFSRYAKVVEADGKPMSVRQALALINEVLQEVLSEEETEFDADTRWALTWFEQYGLNPGPYGDAETLSKAKGTAVSGVVQAGIAAQLDGNVRLLERDELDPGWDPALDGRLTVWEVAQHLIARLGESETAAADLLRQVGPGVGERARQLAYLLYQIADRKGWASEAVAYNSLVQAWPELTRLAGRPDTAVQPTLGG